MKIKYLALLIMVLIFIPGLNLLSQEKRPLIHETLQVLIKLKKDAKYDVSTAEQLLAKAEALAKERRNEINKLYIQIIRDLIPKKGPQPKPHIIIVLEELISVAKERGLHTGEAEKLLKESHAFARQGDIASAHNTNYKIVNIFRKNINVATMDEKGLPPLIQPDYRLSDYALQFTGMAINLRKMKDELSQLKRLTFYIEKMQVGEKSFSIKLTSLEDIYYDLQSEMEEFKRNYKECFNKDIPDPIKENMRLISSKFDKQIQKSWRDISNKLCQAIQYIEQHSINISRTGWQELHTAESGRIKASMDMFREEIIFSVMVRHFWDTWEIFKELGFDVITPGWRRGAKLERICKSEGAFDFSYLDRIIDKNWQEGYKTNIEVEWELPEWFWYRKKRGDKIIDDEFRNSPIVWDPGIRKLIKDYLTALGHHFKQNSEVFGYEVWNEPNLRPLKNGIPDPRYFEKVKTYFHDYLRKKYGNIDKLNRIWGTQYKDFKEIFPPKETKDTNKSRFDSSFRYEFGKFRREGLADFLWMCVNALKEADPFHPLIPGIAEWKAIKFGNPDQDAFLTLTAGGWDAISIHESGGGRPGAPWNNLNYVYSLNQFLDKKIWNEEFIYNAPEGRYTNNQFVIEAVIERNIWQQLAWGIQGFTFFELDNSFKDWNNSMMEKDTGFGILKSSIATIPLMKDKAQKYKNLLLNSRIYRPPIAILHSSTSDFMSKPWGTPYNEYLEIERILFENYYHYFFLPEQVILEDKENLSEYGILILPYDIYLNKKLGKKLLNYIKKGGTIFSVGLSGLYDPLGNRNPFIRELFGNIDVRYSKKIISKEKIRAVVDLLIKGEAQEKIKVGGWIWKVNPDTLPSGTKSIHSNGNHPLIISRDYGKGKVIFTTQSIAVENREIKEQFLKLLKSNLPDKLAWSDKPGDIELIMRIDDKGNEYLFIINLNAESTIKTKITIPSVYRHLTDIGIGKRGVSIPGMIDHNITSFYTLLAPGQGTVIALRK